MKHKSGDAPKCKAVETSAPVPQFVDFIQDTSDWLATLGRVDDADSQIEIIGIKQRLVELRDPRIEPERFGRLMSECSRFRRDLEIRRKVMPDALYGEKYRDEQSRKAQLPRGRIDTDGEKTSVKAILDVMALKTDEMGEYLKSNELWPELYAELERLGLDPEDVDEHYNFRGGKIGYASFKVMLSNIRKSKS